MDERIVDVPGMIVYYSRKIIKTKKELYNWINEIEESEKNLDISFVKPGYQYIDYLEYFPDKGYLVEYGEQVKSIKENLPMLFKEIKPISLFGFYFTDLENDLLDKWHKTLLNDFQEYQDAYEISGPIREILINNIFIKDSFIHSLFIALPIKNR